MDKVTKSKLLKLQVGDQVRISNLIYVIEGVIKFYNSTSKWVEYKLASLEKEVAWLNVEEEAALEISLYRENSLQSSGYGGSSFEYCGRIYQLETEGTATVYTLRGEVDVETNERVKYYEYADQTKQELLSVEVWEDEVEISLGRWIEDIEIIPQTTGMKASHSRLNQVSRDGLILGGLVLIGIIGVLLWFFRDSIAKKIGKDETFQYLSSITSNYDPKDRATVYTSKLSVPQNNLTLQKMEVPVAYSELSQPHLQLVYPDHYVIIYEGYEKTLLQVSSRKYIFQNGYTRIYGSKNQAATEKYLNDLYLASDYYQEDQRKYGNPYASRRVYHGAGSFIRLHSTRVRRFSGGGISFGK